MDKLRTIEIEYSPVRMIMILVGGVAMAALSGLLAFRIIPDPRAGPGSFHEFIAYVGLVFFSLAAVSVLWRLAVTRGPVVTLTAAGIRDIRIAPEEIPWSAVHAIGACQIRRQRFLVLAVDPAVEAQLRLTRGVRWSRAANRRLGIDGLCVTAHGLKTDYQTLSLICHDRAARAHAAQRSGEESRQAPLIEI